MISLPLSADLFTGRIIEENNPEPISYVNVGIARQGVGTVSDEIGYYSIEIDDRFAKDSIVFSCIGFKPFAISVKDFTEIIAGEAGMTRRVFKMKKLVIKAKCYRYRKLGISKESKTIRQASAETRMILVEGI
jgi:hypothetical protein